MAPRKATTAKVAKEPTRQQPRRAVRDSAKTEAAEAKPAETKPAATRASKAGVKKRETKSRSDTSKQQKKIRVALVKKVDSMDPAAAAAEQQGLLDLSRMASPPETPDKNATTDGENTGDEKKDGRKIRIRVRSDPKKTKEKYMDAILDTIYVATEDNDDNDESNNTENNNNNNNSGNNKKNEPLRRLARWIPDYAHRPKLARASEDNNNKVPHALWMAYQYLDDYIYRRTLTPAEVLALPLLQDVREYQDSDGKGPRPATPEGFRWDESLDLVPI